MGKEIIVPIGYADGIPRIEIHITYDESEMGVWLYEQHRTLGHDELWRAVKAARFQKTLTDLAVDLNAGRITLEQAVEAMTNGA